MIVPFYRMPWSLTGGKRVAEEEREQCVLCRRLTYIAKGMPLAARKGYIEGAGQLCESCFRELCKNGGREPWEKRQK